MFNAYEKTEVAKGLSLQFECIAASETKLFVGTKNGLLITFNINLNPSKVLKPGSQQCPYADVHDMQMCKTFAKKGVSQLQFLENINILLSLSDGLINVYDSSKGQFPFPVIHTVNKAKGATLFAVDCKIIAGETTMLLAAVVKRKIMIFQWNGNEFLDFVQKPEIPCPDTPKVVVWCDDCLAVGYRDEYVLITVIDSEDPKEAGRPDVCHLFNTGSKAIEPLILKIPSAGIVGFCRDERTVFRNFAGDPVPAYSDIMWTDVPLALEFDSPFVVAVLGRNCIEVRTLRPSVLVQCVGDLKKCRWITSCANGLVFATNGADIWCLSAKTEIVTNIQKLVKDKQYDIAVQLCQRLPLGSAEMSWQNDEKTMQIKNLWAFHLFCQRKFTESLALFKEVKAADVLYVIGLFPDLVTEEIRKQISYPGTLSDKFTKAELEEGLQALQSYLSEIRTNIASELDRQKRLQPEKSTERLDPTHLTELAHRLEIVDTTLLQCYLQTNEMLVASLLRLPDNACNLEKTERILMEHGKHSELFLLYERKELHQQALELLQMQAKNQHSPLKGIERTILYLQNLGDKHLDLIFKFAEWVLKENPTEGLKIFTEDVPEVENLPRDRVLEFIRRVAPTLVTPYLEHIIYQWFDKRPKFHDLLAEQYVSRVKTLMAEQMHNLANVSKLPPAGQEPGELGESRNMLLYFLGFSQDYNAEMIIVQLPHDSMYEERALMLGKLGRHDQAIFIYTNILHDYTEAERYCRQHYKVENKEDRGVFLTLLRMYASPPADVGIHTTTQRPRPPPNVSLALKILKNFAPFIDLVKALELLPDSITLNELWIAMEAALQDTTNRRKLVEVNRGLNYSRSLRVRCAKAQAQSVKIVIDQDTLCQQCAKKIGNSAFARTSDGSLVHYFCFFSKDKQQL